MPFKQGSLGDLEKLALQHIAPRLLSDGYCYLDHILGEELGSRVLEQVRGAARGWRPEGWPAGRAPAGRLQEAPARGGGQDRLDRGHGGRLRGHRAGAVGVIDRLGGAVRQPPWASAM
ncbi:unnamed protein product [Ranitomeya imitator]|uniref:Uncharacterized protein n=1 Tax=Ranitomeya imitator TaxID=111125 RepID=A0ABN9KYH9_9NEOB|nr:unnamed protein product [Ranitomeya imitator]